MGLNLGGITASVVGYALDGLSLRHTAIAANIANADSVGYRPLQVSFEGTLAALVSNTSTDMTTDVIKNLPKPEISVAASSQTSAFDSSVEMQTVLLNQNVLRYQTLIAGLNKYMSAVSIAVNEGRR
jgi:flagellar basal-body rod protein FlgB